MLAQHFEANEDQYNGDSLLQIIEAADRPAQQKEKRPQAEHCKNIRGVDDKPIARNSHNCRYRIERKYNIDGS